MNLYGSLQNKLVKEVKMIALAGHAADGFTWTLLKLARFAHSLYFGGAPMLKHLFSKEEYSDAKKKINELTETKKGTAKRKNGAETRILNLTTCLRRKPVANTREIISHRELKDIKVTGRVGVVANYRF